MYTFAQPLNRAPSTTAGSPAVVCQDHRRTYAELGSRCRLLAGGLRMRELVPGEILKRKLREPYWAGQQAHVSGG